MQFLQNSVCCLQSGPVCERRLGRFAPFVAHRSHGHAKTSRSTRQALRRKGAGDYRWEIDLSGRYPSAPELDDRAGIATLVAVPRAEFADIGRRGEVIAERLLQGARSVAVQDDAVRLAVGVEPVEETLH